MNIFGASRNGDINRINELLDSGTNVNQSGTKGGTALMWASGFSNTTSNIETVKLLLDRGANVNMDNAGSTTLMIAVRNSNTTSNIETVKLLLDRGANINFQNNDGWTALMIASRYSGETSNIETVKLLLERGADPFVKLKGKNIPELCPTNECKQLISKAIWNRLYQTDKKLAKEYSLSGNIPLPKDVWELILLNKRQQQLCQNLSSNKNKEILWYFAEMLNIPLDNNLTKAQLCGLISRYLAYGQYVDAKGQKFVNKRLIEDKNSILRMAQRFGIDANRPMNKILEDLSKLII